MLRPVKVYCVDMIGSKWVLLETLQRDHLIARAFYAFDIEQLRQEPHVSPVFIQGLTSLIRSKPRESKNPTQQPLDNTDAIKAYDNGVSDIPQDQTSSGFQLPLNTYQYLLRCMADISPDNLIGKIKRVQISDCGGQPQFHEILPIFVRGPTLYLFVFKLNESLSNCPQVSYYVDGKPIGALYSSTESVEQLLENCLRVIRSQKAVAAQEEATHVQTATNYSQIAKDKDKNFPRIMIIGTHKDKEDECEAENREAKNKKLVQLLLPEFKKEIYYYRQKPKKEVVYPINARFPGEHEENVAEVIRNAVLTNCSKEFEIPLQWHALEVLLEKLTTTLDRQVLTKEECFAAAQTLHFDSEAALDAALDYLGHLNLVFYYPDILPNVVFVSSQILLDKVTELVKAVYQMNEGATATSTSTVQGELWQRFCDYAYVSAEFLKQKCFQEHYNSRFFTHDDLIVLFRKLLIFADFNSTEYFVPALLKKLKREELDGYRARPTAPIAAPLIFLFEKHGGPLLGVFCATVVSLLSEDNIYPCPWKLIMDPEDEVTPICLYRNCVQFWIPEYSGIITLIESFEHIEVHVSGIAGEDCQIIKQSISKALHKATIALHYEFSVPKVGFSCPCDKSTFHLAKISVNRKSWICTKNVCTSGALNSNQKIWLDPKEIHIDKSSDPTEAVLSTSSIPRLHQLQQLKGNGKEIRIIECIALKWSNVALGLRFEHYTIDMIREDSHHQSEQACHLMLHKWLNGEGRMPTTWQTFIEALHEANLYSVVQEIQAIVN